MNNELIKGSTITLILNELSKEPMYGYKIIKEIEGKSNGTAQDTYSENNFGIFPKRGSQTCN